MMVTSPHPATMDLDRLQRLALAVGVAGLVICLIGAPFSPTQFFRSYLVAYQFCLGIALGCFVILMLYQLTGGAWGYLIRRLLEAGMLTLPILALLFVPLAFGLKYLYIWARPEEVAGHEVLGQKQVYLNIPFYLGRTAFYFLVWLVIAYFLNSLSRRQEQTGDPLLSSRLRKLSAAGLVVYGLTITFAATDWVMSLQPAWYSTIFAALFATGQILSAYAFVIAFLGLLLTPGAMLSRPQTAETQPMQPGRESMALASVASPDVLNDLGNLLLAFVILWTYMTFAQFLLIWVGNLPEEIIWYLPRMRDGWQWVAMALLLFHFALPFLSLLSRDVKRNPHYLALVAGAVLFMRLVHLNWEVLPAFPGTALYEHWMDLVAPLGVGGIWLAFFVWQLKRRPSLPLHDPSRQEAVHLHEHDLREAIHHG